MQKQNNQKKKTLKVKPLLRVYSAVTGSMALWIKLGRFMGNERVFYSAEAIAPLLTTLRGIKTKDDLIAHADELLAHADNVNNKDLV